MHTALGRVQGERVNDAIDSSLGVGNTSGPGEGRKEGNTKGGTKKEDTKKEGSNKEGISTGKEGISREGIGQLGRKRVSEAPAVRNIYYSLAEGRHHARPTSGEDLPPGAENLTGAGAHAAVDLTGGMVVTDLSLSGGRRLNFSASSSNRGSNATLPPLGVTPVMSVSGSRNISQRNSLDRPPLVMHRF